MSIFKTEKCPICGTPTSAMLKSSVKYDGLYVCQDCAKKFIDNGINLWQVKKYSLGELQRIVGTSEQSEQEHMNEVSSFNATRRVGNYVHFDDTNKKFAIPKTSFGGSILDLKIYNYSDILDYELIEDENSISKGGVGRALVGGVLFGGVGAIVGGSTGHKQKSTCSKLQIKITMNNMNAPTIYINFIEVESRKDGIIYKQTFNLAQEALSLFSIICQQNKPSVSATTEPQAASSTADEIRKYKQLLDDGIITQEEFDSKKKQLLGF